ncbi:MAG: histone deacetylase family protein [Thermosphaera sp.]
MVRIIVENESLNKHIPLEKHPENPARVAKIIELLRKIRVDFEYSRPEVDLEEARRIAFRIHAKGYIEYLERLSRNRYSIIDEDTYLAHDSLELAYRTFGSCYGLASKLHDIVFYVTRPPGHHAGIAGKAMRAFSQGFCLLNNPGAAVLAFKDRGFSRIAILDFDVHHGNGTMEIFYRDKILHIDLHQHPRSLYPYTGYPFEIGVGEGYGFKANLVFSPFTGDDVYIETLNMVSKLLEEYNPEALVVSAGFDAYVNDGLADLRLTEASYYVLGRLIRDLKSRSLIVLEGGYSVGLVKGVESFLKGLWGFKISINPSRSMYHANSREDLSVNEKTILKIKQKVLGKGIGIGEGSQV